MSFLKPMTIPCADLENAVSRIRCNLRYAVYRNRQGITEDDLLLSLAWLELPKNDIDGHEFYVRDRRTATIVAANNTEALSNKLHELNCYTFRENNAINIVYLVCYSTECFDSAKQKLELDNYKDVGAAPALTTTPYHKVQLFERLREDCGSVDYYVVTNTLSQTFLWKASATILARVPWDFEHKDAFAQAFYTGDGDVIAKQINDTYDTIRKTLAEARRLRNISHAVQNYRDRGKARLERDIERAQQKINELYNTISSYQRDLNRKKEEYYTRTILNQATGDAENDPLLVFLKSLNSALKTVRVNPNGTKLDVVYRTPLLYFDATQLKHYFESSRENCINEAPVWEQQLIKDIFLDNKYTLYITSGAALYLADVGVSYCSPGDYLETSDLDGVANPHHEFYDCWGDNATPIRRALEAEDIVTALAQTFAAMASLNFSDTAVINKFVQRTLMNAYNSNKCLQNNETKELISISEYRRRYNNNGTTTQTEQQRH